MLSQYQYLLLANMQQNLQVKPVVGKASTFCWNCKHAGNDNRNHRETVGTQNNTGNYSTFCGDFFCSELFWFVR